MKLVLLEPAVGTRGVHLEFACEDSARITAYEIYAGFDPDSVLSPIQSDLPGNQREAWAALPDTSPPYDIYFGIRGVSRLETGEVLRSEPPEMTVLRVLEPVRLYQPAANDTLRGSGLIAEVGISSDQGVLLRQTWWELGDLGWGIRLDTCFPQDQCLTPSFGNRLLRDSVHIQADAGASVSAMLCIAGSEDFDDRQTARRQSLSCSRFERKSP